MRTWFPTVLTLVALVTFSRLAHAQDTGAGGDAVVQGTVVDHDSGAPLVGAVVRLVGQAADSQSLVPLLTNEQGRFAFRRVPGGIYSLQAEMLGYQARQDTLVIERGTEIRVTLELSVSPVPLDPLVVEVVSRPNFNIEQFEARRARLHGAFFDREAIESRFAARFSDLLIGSLPSVSIVGGRPNNLRGGGGGFSSNRCPMTVYLDGVPTAESLDNLVPPDAIEAMEVYTSLAEVPVQYRTGRAASCGVVLIWLRGGVSPEFAANRQPGTIWKGALAVVGVVSLLWAVSR